MHRVELDGVRVEYELTGDGEPVVLPHARPFVMWYLPLVERLHARRVLRYRRDLPADRPWAVEDDARLCAALLDRLGVERPHVVGHSYGGLVALELVRGVPLRSVALLEPATVGLLPPDEATRRTAPLETAARVDGPASAMDRFLRAIAGADGPEVLDEHVPGALGDALTHAARFFTVELPAAARWSFGPADAAEIAAPVLHLRGADSAPRFAEGGLLLEKWFPSAEHRVLDGVNHLMMAWAPETTADVLDRFWRGC